jgi:hypothetical protein
MSDTFMVPTPEGWLRLPADVYRAYLTPYPAVNALPAPSGEASEVMPALVDGKELARMTGLPVSLLMERARRGTLPSIQVGKYRRFDPQAVIAHLTDKQLVASKALEKTPRAKAWDRNVTTRSRKLSPDPGQREGG